VTATDVLFRGHRWLSPEHSANDHIDRFVFAQSPSHQGLDLFLIHAADCSLMGQLCPVVNHDQPGNGAGPGFFSFDDLDTIDVPARKRRIADGLANDLALATLKGGF
jgi:hypothetical protein